MADLKPFEGATNKTAIAIFEKGKSTSYPVNYSHWYKPTGGAVIPEFLSLDEVVRERVATYHQFIAYPIDENNLRSPWLTGRSRTLQAIKKVISLSNYQAHLGVNVLGASGVYWVNITHIRPDGFAVINNLSEVARREVENIQTAIEPNLLYPLLRGRDVQRWHAQSSASIIVPHTPESSWQAIPESIVREQYPKTYSYLFRFRDYLLSRAGYILLRPGHPFYILGDIHTYSFSPYKVVWREQAGTLTVAVIEPEGGHSVIPNHKLIMVPFGSKAEAHFLCAILNSSPARLIVYSYSITIQMDTHVLKYVKVPTFIGDNYQHTMLASLSMEAHTATSTGDTGRVKEIEAEIDRLAAQLWGLTDEELKEIQESLEELG